MFSDVQQEGLMDNEGTTKLKNKEQIEKMKRLQQERIDKLADTLIHKLNMYTDTKGEQDDIKKFQESIKHEAEKLKNESYGIELLHSIGGVYTLKARHHLGIKGGGMPSIFVGFKQKKHIVKELWTTVKVAMDVQQTAELISKAEQSGMNDSEKLKLEEEIATKVSSKKDDKFGKVTKILCRLIKHYGKHPNLRWKQHYVQYAIKCFKTKEWIVK